MTSNNLSVWAVTTQNEPSMGLFISSDWNAIGWTPKHQVEWLEKDLIPLFQAKNISTKIFVLDDNRIFVPNWVDRLFASEIVRNFTHGVAMHWYWDDFVPASVIGKMQEKYPEKEIIGSEACSVRGERLKILK